VSNTSNKSEPPSQRIYFTSQERVRLTFLLGDNFSPVQHNVFRDQVSGYEWDFLYQLLQRNLGRLSLANGYDAISAIQDFILHQATEDELLTMLQLMPEAYIKASEHTRNSDYEAPSAVKIRGIMAAINDFLGRIGSPAHFDENGRFIRGVAASMPQSPQTPVDSPSVQDKNAEQPSPLGLPDSSTSQYAGCFLTFVLVAALVLALIAGIRYWPTLETAFRSRTPKPHPLNWRWIGSHGKNKKVVVFVHGIMGDMDTHGLTARQVRHGLNS
jgi:hypothetical protein